MMASSARSRGPWTVVTPRRQSRRRESPIPARGVPVERRHARTRNPGDPDDVYRDDMTGWPEPGEEEFETLLTDARGGTGSALRRVYEWLGPAVAGYLRSQSLPDPEAATNEVFFRAFTRLHQFRGTARGLRSWIFTIAHNLVIDERRKLARRPNEQTTGDAADLDRPTTDSESRAWEGAGLDTVRELLAHVTEPQRDVLFLRVIAGLSVAETARIVGRPSGAVKALQHRGLATLRALLASRTVSESTDGTFP